MQHANLSYMQHDERTDSMASSPSVHGSEMMQLFNDSEAQQGSSYDKQTVRGALLHVCF